MIDFEEGRISIRLSEGTYYALQRDIADFCFVSNDGSYNENGFYNTILPALHKNRILERTKLRRIFEKRFSDKIKPQYKNELLNELDDIFNLVQFDDKITKYHQAKVDIRLSKNNMKLFADVFSLLETQKIPKSSYIRNLLNQYACMRTDDREYLCYENVYEEIMDAADEHQVLEFSSKFGTEDFIPITVDLCCYDNEFYVIGIVPEYEMFFLKSYRLCEFKKYKIKFINYEVGNSIYEEAETVISEFGYYNKPPFCLKGNDNGIIRCEKAEKLS